VDGEGNTLVLLHGFPMDSRVWDNAKQRFASYFEVICIDLPGFGQTENLHETHSMVLMAEAVHAVLTHENIKKCLLLGHSMGGYVALAFAKLFPDILKGWILLHSHAAEDDATGKEKRDKAIQSVLKNKANFLNSFMEGLFVDDFANKHPEKVDFIRYICLSQSEQAITAALRGIRDRQNQLNLLKKIQVPVLFILGKNDIRMPFIKIMEQAQLPAHAELLILDQVAHFGFMEKPEITGLTIGMFATKCFPN